MTESRSARLFGAWVLVTAFGFSLGYPLARLTFNFGLSPLTPFGVLPKWVVAGMAAGILEMRLLRPCLARPWIWAVATTFGFAIGGLVASVPTAEPSNQVINWGVAGVLAGTAQWIVLRRHLHAAGLWVPTAAFAWALAGAGRYMSTQLLPDTVSVFAVSAVAWGVAGLIIALVGGLAITSLLSPSPPPR
jgi:hypothetical protein